MLNTPLAVLAMLVIFVIINSFLYFGYYLPRTTTAAPALPTQIERTNSSTTFERTRPRPTIEETTTSTATPSPGEQTIR